MVSKSGLVLAALAGVAMASPAYAEATANHPAQVDGPQQVKYPMDAQRAGEEGTVGIQVYVTDTGVIHTARIVHPSGNDALDNAALESVLGWHFKPGEQDGQPVSGWTTVQVVYKVPGISAPAHQ